MVPGTRQRRKRGGTFSVLNSVPRRRGGERTSPARPVRDRRYEGPEAAARKVGCFRVRTDDEARTSNLDEVVAGRNRRFSPLPLVILLSCAVRNRNREATRAEGRERTARFATLQPVHLWGRRQEVVQGRFQTRSAPGGFRRK
jgi:hypothetical protein